MKNVKQQISSILNETGFEIDQTNRNDEPIRISGEKFKKGNDWFQLNKTLHGGMIKFSVVFETNYKIYFVKLISDELGEDSWDRTMNKIKTKMSNAGYNIVDEAEAIK
jgi:hypothetical protein